MDENDFAKLGVLQKDLLFLRGFVANNKNLDLKDFKKIEFKDTITNFNFNYYKAFVDSLQKDTLQIMSFSQNKIEGQITLHKNKLLFFSIPYEKGWTVKVDGKKEALFVTNFGFMGLTLPAGNHTIVLSYDLPCYNTFSIFVMVLAIAVYLFLIYWMVLRKNNNNLTV